MRSICSTFSASNVAEAKRRLEERKGRPVEECAATDPEIDLERVVLARPVLRRGGRREWPRIARRELEAHRARDAEPIPRDRDDRLFQALARFEQNHRIELAAHEDYDRWRATARDTWGRVLKGNGKPFTPPELPEGVINLSDPDSRVMRTQGTPPRQAYNAQTAVNDGQIILAAEITVDAADFGHLEPILDTTLATLERHGVTEQPGAVIGDAGYWHTRQIEAITERVIEVLIPPDGTMRDGKRPGWEKGPLRTDAGSCCQAIAAASSTHNGRSPSNRSTARSNTTEVLIGSCEEAEPPRSRSGGW